MGDPLTIPGAIARQERRAEQLGTLRSAQSVPSGRSHGLLLPSWHSGISG